MIMATFAFALAPTILIKSASAMTIIAIITGRADAKTTIANLNANCPSGEERSSTGKRDYIKRKNDKKDVRRLGGEAPDTKEWRKENKTI